MQASGSPGVNNARSSLRTLQSWFNFEGTSLWALHQRNTKTRAEKKQNMQLLSDIINELVDSQRSLVDPLLKTRVLASRIGNNDLKQWVSRELDGYGTDDNLPEYRVTGARVTMNYLNGPYQINNQPIPMGGMSEKAKRLLDKTEFRQTIATLQSYSIVEEGVLSMYVSAELVAYIQKFLKKNGQHPHLHILSVSKLVSSHGAVEVLAIVRNRLLDFMLKLEEEFGSQTDIESLRRNNETINSIMNNFITNTGDGNVISTGNHSSVKAKIEIKKGDLSKLTEGLLAAGVQKEDVVELTQAIQVEPTATKQYGPEVNLWMRKMMDKALDGSWQIGLGAAGGVLAELINAYYGIK